jgi:hypothetical protein
VWNKSLNQLQSGCFGPSEALRVHFNSGQGSF